MSVHRAAEPIGLQVINTAQSVSSALDVELKAAGGSLGMWRILVDASGNDERHGAQSAVSEGVGVGADTLSDDVHRMENAGLIVRNPNPQHFHEPRVALTEAGRATFHRLLRVVLAFDALLRTGLAAEDLDVFSTMLTRIRSNIASTEPS